MKDNGLEDHHSMALLFIKVDERISNKQYQELFNVSKRTASYDPQLLSEKNLAIKVGSTGKGTYHIYKGAIGATNGSKGAKWQPYHNKLIFKYFECSMIKSDS